MQTYARGLLPIVDRTRKAFDGASASVQGSPDLASAGLACASLSQQVVLLQDEADGVPHPYPFYTHIANLHFDVLGAYHLMLGGLSACTAAADNEDDGAYQGALSDIVSADQAMRGLDDRIHALR
jgi:hypothetical protein